MIEKNNSVAKDRNDSQAKGTWHLAVETRRPKDRIQRKGRNPPMQRQRVGGATHKRMHKGGSQFLISKGVWCLLGQQHESSFLAK